MLLNTICTGPIQSIRIVSLLGKRGEEVKGIGLQVKVIFTLLAMKDDWVVLDTMEQSVS